MSNQTEVQNVNPITPSNEIGIVCKGGQEVSYGAMSGDVQLAQHTSVIHVGGGGDLIVRGVDGKDIPYYGLLDGDWIPVVTDLVLQSATIGGVPRTTTATQITAHW